MSDNPGLVQQGGDDAELYQAGRDQSITLYKIEAVSKSVTNALKELVEAYKKEVRNEEVSTTGQFIEKLNFFMNTVDGDFLTLEEKLALGGFKADISLARRLKQQYSMALQEIKHINSAQKIHAYLLGTILVNFSVVYDYLVKEDRPDNIFIKGLIERKVVDPVEHLINLNENALQLFKLDIHSMIYYLTGNCHINWS